MENPSTLPSERERNQKLADLRGANLFLTKKLLNAYASSNKQKKALEERDTELDLLRWKVSYLQGTVTCLDETLMREHALRRKLEKQPNESEANLEVSGTRDSPLNPSDVFIWLYYPGPPIVYRRVTVAELDKQRVAALESLDEIEARALEAEETCDTLRSELDQKVQAVNQESDYNDWLEAENETLANDKARAEAENAILRNTIPYLLGMIRRLQNLQPHLWRRIRDAIA
ncbi:hypothetical protein PG987_010767 [Apiospora arundinis]